MNSSDVSMDASASKDIGWYTAIYNYAEFLRLYTEGQVNHKTLYGLVGSHGAHVAHENALVRKRTAGNLSKLIHSSRYAADIALAHEQDPALFDQASLTLLHEILTATSVSVYQLVEDLLETAWPQLRAGLLSEIAAGRMGVSISRADSEMALVRDWADTMCAEGESSICAKTILCSFFWLLTYGHIEDHFANSLVDSTPTNLLEESDMPPENAASRACVVRLAEGDSSAIENIWTLSTDTPFEIGRYMTCDAIEVEGRVSRKHCRIYFEQGKWIIEDEHSRYGTQVVRGDSTVWDSLDPEAGPCFELSFGDTIILAQKTTYWFVALQNAQRAVVG